MGLTVKRVERLLRAGVPGKYTDGDVKGLMLCVESKSSAHWLLRYQRDHKVRHLGLGGARGVVTFIRHDRVENSDSLPSTGCGLAAQRLPCQRARHEGLGCIVEPVVRAKFGSAAA